MTLQANLVKVKVFVYSLYSLVLAVAPNDSHNSIGITLPHSEGMERTPLDPLYAEAIWGSYLA